LEARGKDSKCIQAKESQTKSTKLRLRKDLNPKYFPAIDFSSKTSALSYKYWRLTMEDVVHFEVGASVVLLVSDQHPSWTTTWLPILQSLLYETDPTQPSIFDNIHFYSIRMEIRNHPFQDRILTRALTVDKFVYLCSEVGGTAINIKCASSGVAIQLKLYDTFYGHSSLHLWSTVHHNSNSKRQLSLMMDHKH
jgi:hypothetical protein